MLLGYCAWKVLLMKTVNSITASKWQSFLVRTLAVQEMHLRYECILQLFGNAKKRHTPSLDSSCFSVNFHH